MKLAIIGNGVAGVTTARYVAELDPAIDIVIYSDEVYAYYPRPRLIDLLAGETSSDGIIQYPDAWYAERGIRTVWEPRSRLSDPTCMRSSWHRARVTATTPSCWPQVHTPGFPRFPALRWQTYSSAAPCGTP